MFPFWKLYLQRCRKQQIHITVYSRKFYRVLWYFKYSILIHLFLIQLKALAPIKELFNQKMSHNFIITGILNPVLFNWFFQCFSYAGFIMQSYPELVQFNLVHIMGYISKIHSQETKCIQFFSERNIALLFITCKTRSIPYVRVKKKSSHKSFSKNYLLNAQKSIACGIAQS